MNQFQLPDHRILNVDRSEALSKEIVMVDVFPVKDGEVLSLAFESVNSSWRQGVRIQAEGYLVVNSIESPAMEVWYDTAPKNMQIECHTSSGLVHVYNIWDRGKGRDSQAWTSGMIIQELPQGRRYQCNDIGFETSFDKVVFRLERS